MLMLFSKLLRIPTGQREQGCWGDGRKEKEPRWQRNETSTLEELSASAQVPVPPLSSGVPPEILNSASLRLLCTNYSHTAVLKIK